MKKALLVLLAVLIAVPAGVLAFVRFAQDRPGSFRLDLDVPSSGEGLSTALEQTVGSPLRGGHKVELLKNGAVFDGLTAAIEAAQHSVHIEMYIWTKGEASRRVTKALAAAHRKGVRCAILLDALGSHSRGAEVDEGLMQAGCELRLFRQHDAPTARNHRKLAIVDGRVGFTGGFGVDDRWLGDAQDEDHWRDTSVRIEGPAVTQMQDAFAQDWNETAAQLLPAEDFPKLPETGGVRAAFIRSSASPIVTPAERVSQLGIDAAHKRLWISNAYFIPGRPVLDLLERSGDRKVDVRLLVPGRKSDSKISWFFQQREYGELQKHGIRPFEFQPAMMHAKTMVIDDALAIVASVNLDPLSLDRLEDGALVVEDPALVREMAQAFEADCARASEQR